MKNNYEDTAKGAKELLLDIYGDQFNPDIVEPDPCALDVWIAISSTEKRVIVAFLNSGDAEEITYRTNNWQDYLA